MLMLCGVLFCAQILAAEHLAEPDCEDEFCFLCHSSADEEYTGISAGFENPELPASPQLSLPSRSPSSKPVSISPIRGPPQASL